MGSAAIKKPGHLGMTGLRDVVAGRRFELLTFGL